MKDGPRPRIEKLTACDFVSGKYWSPQLKDDHFAIVIADVAASIRTRFWETCRVLAVLAPAGDGIALTDEHSAKQCRWSRCCSCRFFTHTVHSPALRHRIEILEALVPVPVA